MCLQSIMMHILQSTSLDPQLQDQATCLTDQIKQKRGRPSTWKNWLQEVQGTVAACAQRS